MPPPRRPDGRCKKHPKHSQAPGVCSVCLSEKLSQLRTTGSSRVSSSAAMDSCSSSSSSSSLSSCSSSVSSCSSPMYKYRFPSEGKGSLGFLTKSRSMAFVSRIRRSGEKERGNGGDEKKRGFWSKLLRPSASHKRIEERLVHSRTMRESVNIVTAA